MSVISMKQLLEAGVHFGHQTRRWNPKMAPYIYTERNGIYIIDLQKSVGMVDDAYKAVADIAADGGTILFVGTKKQAQDAIKTEAERCGQFYVNERWLGGMLTNFKTIQTRIAKLRKIEKMEADGARANDISNEERTDAIVGFCDTIKDAGYTPMIYANRNWYAQNLDMDRLGDYQLWLAQYSNVPDFPYLFTGWQYTSEGSVPGISGSVDIDVWMK